MGNVIQFPSKNRAPSKDEPTREEVVLNVSKIKYGHIHETLETVIPMLLRNMELAGFDIIPEEDEEDPCVKDTALIVEAIRSLMCKFYDIDHPFQELSESLFNRNKDGTFALSKRLDLDFSKFEETETEES